MDDLAPIWAYFPPLPRMSVDYDSIQIMGKVRPNDPHIKIPITTRMNIHFKNCSEVGVKQ